MGQPCDGATGNDNKYGGDGTTGYDDEKDGDGRR